MNRAEEPEGEEAAWSSSQAVITATPSPSSPLPMGDREATVVIRRLDPLSVLRVSLVFYFCVMLIFVFALAIVYWVLGLIGVLNSVSHFLSNLGLGSTRTGFQFSGGWIFLRIFLVGLVSVVIWSLVNVFLVFLYNLVADVVGGIRMTISEGR